MMFLDLQLTEVLISLVKLIDVDFTLVQVSMNRQILQLLHFFMPGSILVGLLYSCCPLCYRGVYMPLMVGGGKAPSDGGLCRSWSSSVFKLRLGALIPRSVCWSVGRSVGWSVGPSIGWSVLQKLQKITTLYKTS